MATWNIPALGTICPTCGHDMSAHTGPCVYVASLKEILGEGESCAEATLDGVTVQVEQYPNTFTKQLFWLFAEELCDFEVTYDRDYMESELAGKGFDPDAAIWHVYD